MQELELSRAEQCRVLRCRVHPRTPRTGVRGTRRVMLTAGERVGSVTEAWSMWGAMSRCALPRVPCTARAAHTRGGGHILYRNDNWKIRVLLDSCSPEGSYKSG